MSNNNNKTVVRNPISTIQFASFKGREIAEAATQDTPIRDLIDDEPIRQSLRYVFALIGLKAENLPTDVQKIVLLEFIQTELKHFTPEELKLAFRMAVAGELNVEILHFQNFNAVYLANVMNAYKLKRGLALVEMNQKLKALEPKKQPNEAEQIATFWEYIEKYVGARFEEYRTTKQIDWDKVILSDHMFLQLEKLGIIDLSNERKNKIMIIAESQVKTKWENERTNSRDRVREVRELHEALAQGVKPPQNFQQKVITRAREIAIEQTFASMLESNIDFQETIQSIKSNQYE
jgi:hypothetical protein